MIKWLEDILSQMMGVIDMRFDEIALVKNGDILEDAFTEKNISCCRNW